MPAHQRQLRLIRQPTQTTARAAKAKDGVSLGLSASPQRRKITRVIANTQTHLQVPTEARCCAQPTRALSTGGTKDGNRYIKRSGLVRLSRAAARQLESVPT